jgi:phospholipase C
MSVNMKIPPVVDRNDPWFHDLCEDPERHQMFLEFIQQFGVDPEYTWRVEIQGDVLVAFEYHRPPEGVHQVGDCPGLDVPRVPDEIVCSLRKEY